MPSLIFSGPFWAYFDAFPEKTHFFIENGVFASYMVEIGPSDPSRRPPEKLFFGFSPKRGGLSCTLAVRGPGAPSEASRPAGSRRGVRAPGPGSRTFSSSPQRPSTKSGPPGGRFIQPIVQAEAMREMEGWPGGTTRFCTPSRGAPGLLGRLATPGDLRPTGPTLYACVLWPRFTALRVGFIIDVGHSSPCTPK